MTQQIHPHQLPFALEQAPQAKILSLDCFDTLLWRDTSRPTGVFGALEAVNVGQRMEAETQARKMKAVLHREHEVFIEDIYARAMPHAERPAIKAAIEDELEAEARCCFAFAPTVSLMRAAKARGMSVVIASDTYLNADQLGELIEASAGEEVRALIDRIFCSSQIGRSKSQGMLADVMKKLRCAPRDILHIGDNKGADYDGARELGIPALHLLQFSDNTVQRLRLEETVAKMALSQAKASQAKASQAKAPSNLQPHRAQIAVDEPQITDPARALGFTVLGPLFSAFESWLADEARALARHRAGKVHWLFMLRDGYLPMQVHLATQDKTNASMVEISRFAAIASSLTDKAAIEEHAAIELGLKPETLARQMFFEEQEVAAYSAREDHEAASKDLHRELCKGQRQKVIQRRSRAFAGRLIAHVRQACDPQPGDTLMLVDLGYNGSAQNRIDKLLSQELGVHVAGRYMLLRERDATGLDKKGLIDEEHFAPAMLEALCANVSVLEQLSTMQIGSTIDYTEEGTAIRSQSSIKGHQSEVRERIQAGCIAYARKARQGKQIRRQDVHHVRARRESAFAVMARLMYLPQLHELEVVKQFEHDVNMGSQRMVTLFDPQEAQEGLRQRGLFYMLGSERMYLPAEIASQDISLRLSLFTQKAFGLQLSYAESAPSTLALPVTYMRDHEKVEKMLMAQPTHDGYLALRIPIGAARFAVEVGLGQCLQWVEIQSIAACSLEDLQVQDSGALPRPIYPLRPHLQGIQERATGLFECVEEDGTIRIDPPLDEESAGDVNLMVEIIFRPLLARARQASVEETHSATSLRIEADKKMAPERRKEPVRSQEIGPAVG